MRIRRSRIAVWAAFTALLPVLLLGRAATISPVAGGELRFCLHAEPKTFNPLLVSEEPDEIISFLTGAVLIRMNRQTQAFEGELAESWRIGDGGRNIEFRLRGGVRFSDGAAFQPADVLFTLRSLLDPALHSPAGDPFRGDKGPAAIDDIGGGRIRIRFPVPVAGIERLFDQVPIVSARSLEKSGRPAEMPALGPYRIAEYQPGSHLVLRRNPYYWKTDENGRRLPYIDSIRLSIQQNRELELIRFLRGEIHLINSIDPESFDRLAARRPEEARDSGRSLDSEQMWFNQVARAPMPPYRKEWFRSRDFRLAISRAINRADLARVVYRGHAAPGAGPVSPANRFWFNAGLRAPGYDPQAALALLKAGGFAFSGTTLRDRHGNAVEFSLVTNSGNKSRRTAGQHDPAGSGAHRHPAERDHARFRLADRAHDPHFRLRKLPAGPGQRGPGSERADEYLAQLGFEPRLESWAGLARNCVGGRNRPPDARASGRGRAAAPQGAVRSRAANRNRPGAGALPGGQRLAIGDFGLDRQRAPVVLNPQTFWNIDRLYFKSGVPGAVRLIAPAASPVRRSPSRWRAAAPASSLGLLPRSRAGALDDVELSLAPGEILGLVGRSGEGKSTIALAILKLLDERGGNGRNSVSGQGTAGACESAKCGASAAVKSRWCRRVPSPR